MKLFVFSDVHSFYKELMIALNEAGFDKDNPEHVIVSLGDLLDRGLYPIECLEFVNSIPSSRKILIAGNHEDLMVECLERKTFKQHDYHNGTTDTIWKLGYTGVETQIYQLCESCEKNAQLVNYLSELVDYAEVGKYVFTHGWIPFCRKGDDEYLFDENWRHGDWSKARWTNGMEAWSRGIKIPDKTTLCGHWHTSWGHSKLHKEGSEWGNKYSTNPEHRKANFEPFIDEGIVALDACTAFSHKVNVVVIEVD